MLQTEGPNIFIVSVTGTLYLCKFYSMPSSTCYSDLPFHCRSTFVFTLSLYTLFLFHLCFSHVLKMCGTSSSPPQCVFRDFLPILSWAHSVGWWDKRATLRTGQVSRWKRYERNSWLVSSIFGLLL